MIIQRICGVIRRKKNPRLRLFIDYQQVLFVKRKMNGEDMLIIIKDDKDVKRNFQDAAKKHYEVVLEVKQKEN